MLYSLYALCNVKLEQKWLLNLKNRQNQPLKISLYNLQVQKQRVSGLEAVCSLLRSITKWRDAGQTAQCTRENFSRAAAQESMTPSGRGLTAPPSSPQRRNMESSAEADHRRVLCLAMCKYEIIILLKVTHHFMLLL